MKWHGRIGSLPVITQKGKMVYEITQKCVLFREGVSDSRVLERDDVRSVHPGRFGHGKEVLKTPVFKAG